MHLKEVIKELNKLANPEKIAFKKQKFGVIADNSLGIYHKDLKELAKRIGKKVFEGDTPKQQAHAYIESFRQHHPN